MNNKEKQIEQMAKIMCGHDCEECAKETADWRGVSFEKAKAEQCLIKKQAELLYNADCRIIRKDSVVLSREELSKYTETLEHKIDQLNAKLDQERKEFAKTILMAGEKYADVFQGNFAWFLAWIRTKFGLESGVEE